MAVVIITCKYFALLNIGLIGENTQKLRKPEKKRDFSICGKIFDPFVKGLVPSHGKRK